MEEEEEETDGVGAEEKDEEAVQNPAPETPHPTPKEEPPAWESLKPKPKSPRPTTHTLNLQLSPLTLTPDSRKLRVWV